MAGLKQAEEWVLAESNRATRGQKETVAVLVAVGILITGWGGRDDGVPLSDGLVQPTRIVEGGPVTGDTPPVTATPPTAPLPEAPAVDYSTPEVAPYEPPPYGPLAPYEPAPESQEPPPADAEPQPEPPPSPLPTLPPLPVPIG